MKIIRLLCEACGAAISSPQENSLLQCPYCGSQYLVETASPAGQEGLAKTIHQLLISPKDSKFGRLNQYSQDKVIDDVITQLQDHRYVEAIRIIRKYTGLGLAEAKDIADQIPGWGQLADG